MLREQQLVSLCRNDPAACPSDAVRLFMSVVDGARQRTGRALLGEVNRAINLAVRPVADQRKHNGDLWTAPLVTLATGEGDCEDYAIAKLAVLWASGVPEADTRLVIVHDVRLREDHAIAMVKLGGRWLALDNKRFTLVDAADLGYRPLFALGGHGVQALAGPALAAELDATTGPGRSTEHALDGAEPVAL
jgi:predicted transglutaminase-like cysteine proteinase